MSESDLFNMPYFSQIFLMAALHKKQEIADLVTFTGEILDGKLHFLCSAIFHSSSVSIMTNKNISVAKIVFFVFPF